ncbi:TonB-dependent receptor [Spirosoma endophyticum]|uniref:CarboxypepD_reg-like domain-containing protein n=1 Tax=Spirosoma endophyticum TaxID=662367 RepID=A0A1I2C5H9_9BACT|nr:TonB-dependent receptor [Spirosoma endophyticum]SFE63438.1 CarboxypepD_reg-like domain-containing protein [Spirosoma endophyticum]
MRKHLLFIALALLCALPGRAQLNLAGIVTNQKGQPLEGAIIIIKGTSKGTISQANGHFALQSTAALPFPITISYIGHHQENVMVRGNNFRRILVELSPESILTDEVVVAASRVPEDIKTTTTSVEKLGVRQFQQSTAISPYDALQNVKGVDFLTQSLTFKSVNMRGFDSNNNTRFLQLTDGMDNRSPGLGFGFGNVAGIPDLDVESIELVPGASSALYGPDAMQGMMLTTSKNPFTYQGLSVQLKGGVNNVGKANFGPKPYTDLAVRYAKQLGDRMALKVSFQRLDGTDFIADDYSDRSTSARTSFFITDASRGGIATGIGYAPITNANINFEYDGVNVYGDDINSGGAFKYPVNYANVLLNNKFVTRTGYTELDVIGNKGKVFSNRANVALHYKLSDDIEASLSWNYGNGNFIRTNNYREYFPDYQRHQIKAEIRGDNFFLRAYTTQQKADGWNIGQVATVINNTWKSLGQWAAEFGQSYVENKVSIGQARVESNRGRYLPGSTSFNTVRDTYANTYNTDFIPGSTAARGRRFRDNSQLWHYEGMYNFKNILQIADVIAGASLRHYALASGGTLFSRKTDGSEYTINEVGAYLQASKEFSLDEGVTFKPTVAIRYDKNQYLKGGLTPRVSAVLSLGVHNFRASWQTAFRNPTPEQLFLIPVAGAGGEVGGSSVAYNGTGLVSNPGYLQAETTPYQSNTTTTAPKPFVVDPNQFTTEKISTWEVGYKTLIKNKFYIDAFYFASRYTDLITPQTEYQLLTPGGGATALLTPANYRTLQVNVNSANEVFVRGAGIGLEYGLGEGFTVSGNYTHQIGLITLHDARGSIRNDLAGVPVVKRKISNPEVVQLGRTFFNTPENRYNITLSNPRLTERLGATITYRWTDRMWYEQGITAGDVWLPSWTSLDAQISYKVPSVKSIIKLGGTNILNKYYAQGYGLAQIGGLYYVSITFDELMH